MPGCYGGVDPSSGTASLMELARSLGTMAKQGARPKRTIVFANWDAEEFSLTSSTEWGEQHARELSDHAVAYLNVDSAAAGDDFKAIGGPGAQPPRHAGRARRAGPEGKRRRDRRQSPRQRIGLHRVPEFSRRADRRPVVHRPVRRLPLGLRQPPVDAEIRRPGIPPPRRADARVGRDGAAPRERRRRAARLPRHRRAHPRVRRET